MHLPPDAAINRVGPDDHLWTDARQGAADVRDAIVGLFAKDGKPIKRPGDERRQQVLEDQAFTRATLHRQRAAARRRMREMGM